MKKQNIYKEYLKYQPDEFSHYYATWSKNHMGWAKSKKYNKRLAKKEINKF